MRTVNNSYRVLLPMLIAGASVPAHAWEVYTTHDAISRFALRGLIGSTLASDGFRSMRNNFFNTDHRFAGGILYKPEGSTLTLLDWFCAGVNEEDNGTNYLHHFFDPIRNAGLSDIFPGGLDSLHWAYNYAGNPNTWKIARARQYEALTASSPAVRANAFARTMQVLGHVAHLVQDLSQPQHTRNDAHAGEYLAGEGVEFYADQNYRTWQSIQRIYYTPFTGSRAPAYYSPNYFHQKIFTDVPSEVQALWTIGDYRGQNEFQSSVVPGELGPLPLLHGLAELTNFGFVTTDTIFTGDSGVRMSNGLSYDFKHVNGGAPEHRFPYPKIAGSPNAVGSNFPSLPIPDVPWIEDRFRADSGNEVRLPFRQEYSPGGAWPTVSWDIYGSTQNLVQLFMSDKDFDNTCRICLPLAVIYTNGVISAFLRGQLQAMDLNDPFGEAERGHRLVVKNTSNSISELPTRLTLGTWRIYQTDGALKRTPRSLTSEEGPNGYLGHLDQQESAAFHFWPRPWLGQRFLLVWRGKLGTEEGANVSLPFRVRLDGYSGNWSSQGADASCSMSAGYASASYNGDNVVFSFSGAAPVSLQGGYGGFTASGVTFYDNRTGSVRGANGTLSVTAYDRTDNKTYSMGSDGITMRFNGTYADGSGSCSWEKNCIRGSGAVFPTCTLITE